MRLRKKTWRSPGTIFLDSQVFDKDIHVFANFEMYIERLEGMYVSSPCSSFLHFSGYSLTTATRVQVLMV